MSLLTDTAVNARIRAYNHETEEAYLKALNGGDGWKTIVPSNDNTPEPEPVQLDLFPETLQEPYPVPESHGMFTLSRKPTGDAV